MPAIPANLLLARPIGLDDEGPIIPGRSQDGLRCDRCLELLDSSPASHSIAPRTADCGLGLFCPSSSVLCHVAALSCESGERSSFSSELANDRDTVGHDSNLQARRRPEAGKRRSRGFAPTVGGSKDLYLSWFFCNSPPGEAVLFFLFEFKTPRCPPSFLRGESRERGEEREEEGDGEVEEERRTGGKVGREGRRRGEEEEKRRRGKRRGGTRDGEREKRGGGGRESERMEGGEKDDEEDRERVEEGRERNSG